MTNTWGPGMAVVVGLIFAGLTLIAALEWWCDAQNWPSISYRVEGWAVRNQWFGAALLTLVFLLLAHFVLNPLPASPPG